MKRACCLYIVPVKNYFNETERELLSQKGICYSFAAQQGWSIAREFTGVDKIGKYALYDIKTNIREAANNNEFDVLLLSSYKLVEKCDITPFLIEWLINKGIEVWCVVEGKQSIGDQVNNLINFIRFWQTDMQGEVKL